MSNSDPKFLELLDKVEETLQQIRFISGGERKNFTSLGRKLFTQELVDRANDALAYLKKNNQ